MKVLHLHNFGICTRAYKEAYCLSKEGVENILASFKEVPNHYLEMNKIFKKIYKIEKIFTMHEINILEEVYFPYKIKKELKRLIEKEKPDIIHSHNGPDYLTNIAIKIGKKPVIFDIHDPISLSNIQIRSEKMIKLLKKFKLLNFANKTLLRNQLKIEKDTYLNANGRINITDEVNRYFEERYGKLENTIVLQNYMLERDLPKKQHEKLSSQDNEVHVVFEGGVEIGIDPRNFLKIFESIGEKKIHLHLYIYCSNENSFLEYKKLEKRNKYIHIEQYKSGKELIEEFTKYDFGLIPYTEKMRLLDYMSPNKMFGYLSANLPIISLNYKSIVNFLKEIDYGIILNNFDELNKENLLKFISAKKRIPLIKNLIMEKNIHKVIKLYEKVLS